MSNIIVSIVLILISALSHVYIIYNNNLYSQEILIHIDAIIIFILFIYCIYMTNLKRKHIRFYKNEWNMWSCDINSYMDSCITNNSRNLATYLNCINGNIIKIMFCETHVGTIHICNNTVLSVQVVNDSMFSKEVHMVNKLYRGAKII